MAKQKRDLVKVGLVGLCLLFTACASIIKEEDLHEAFLNSLEKRDFITAKQLLNRMSSSIEPTSFSDYEQRYGQVKREYEANCRRQADALIANDQWQASLAKIDECMSALPDPATPLTGDKARIQAERDRRLALAKRDLDIVNAEHWAAKEPLEYEIQSLSNPGISLWWESYQLNRERVRLTESMINCAEQAFKDEQLALAKRCMDAAIALDETYQNPNIDEALAQQRRQQQVAIVRQQKALVREQSIKEQQEKQEQLQELSELTALYRQHLKADRLADALDVMQRMREVAPNDKGVMSAEKDLSLIINSKVTHDLKRGQALYSQGLIQQALFLWQPLVTLDPGNIEVRQSI